MVLFLRVYNDAWNVARAAVCQDVLGYLGHILFFYPPRLVAVELYGRTGCWEGKIDSHSPLRCIQCGRIVLMSFTK